MSKKPNIAAVKAAVKKEKFRHGSAAIVFTVVFIAIVIVINVLVSALTTRFPSMNMDMTLEGLNTLSEDALEVANNVESETTIYLIGAEESIRGDQIYTNYNLKYSQVANLADRLQEANGKIKVEFIDPDLNPTFISSYPDDNLSSGSVLIKTEKRYKVLTVTDLFSIQQDSTTGSYNHFSKVDGALANALYLVNLDTVPVIAVATGHSEMLSGDNLSSFTALLEDNNFEVKEFNMLTEEIPEGAAMVFLGTPTTDYTKEEIAKLEAFVDDTAMESSRTLYITGYPTQSWSAMPNLKTFLAEWGLEPQEGVVLETSSDNVLASSGTDMSFLFADAVGELFDDATYSNLIMPTSASVKTLFTANNDIVTYSLIESKDTAYLSGVEEGEQESPDTAKQTLMAMAQRYMNSTGTVTSNIVVDGCSTQYLSTFIASSTFGNKAMMTDLVKYLTGTTDTRIGLSVNQTQTNTLDITASSAVIQMLGLGVFTIFVPAAVLIAGLVIFLRRRHL